MIGPRTSNARLSTYAKFCSEAYRQEDTVAELIPYTLSRFVDDNESLTTRTSSPLDAHMRIAMAVIVLFHPTKDGGWTGTARTASLDVRLRLAPQRPQTELRRAGVSNIRWRIRSRRSLAAARRWRVAARLSQRQSQRSGLAAPDFGRAFWSGVSELVWSQRSSLYDTPNGGRGSRETSGVLAFGFPNRRFVRLWFGRR